MTPEEIKKIAYYISEKRHKEEEASDRATFILFSDIYADIVAKISERYCIVPKSKVKEYYEDVCEDIRDYDGKGKFGLSCADMTMYQRARGMKQMLYRLFGKDTFEEERE